VNSTRVVKGKRGRKVVGETRRGGRRRIKGLVVDAGNTWGEEGGG
jgi:hypothetical protein